MKTGIISLLFICTFSLSAQDKAIVFSQLEIDGPIKIELIQSDEYKIEVLEEASLVNWEINGKSLVIMTKELPYHDVPVVRIHAKSIKRLDLMEQAILTTKGVFAERRMYINLRKQSIVDIALDTEQLDVNLKQQSILTLSGAADQFTIHADNQSILTAPELSSATMDITANNQSILTINPKNINIKSKLSSYSILNKK